MNNEEGRDTANEGHTESGRNINNRSWLVLVAWGLGGPFALGVLWWLIRWRIGASHSSR